MIIEADMFQDLQLASWRPTRADGVVPVWRPASLRPRKKWYFHLSPKAGKNWCSRLKAIRQEEVPLIWGRVSLFVLFRPSTDWMRLTHIRESSLLYSVCSFKYWTHPKMHLTETPRIMFDQIYGHPLARSKLTHKINYHKRLVRAKVEQWVEHGSFGQIVWYGWLAMRAAEVKLEL